MNLVPGGNYDLLDCEYSQILVASGHFVLSPAPAPAPVPDPAPAPAPEPGPVLTPEETESLSPKGN